MAKTEPGANIVVRKENCDYLREIASRLGFQFSESAVSGQEHLIRFRFQVDGADVARLAEAVPVEIYAYRAVVGKIRSQDD